MWNHRTPASLVPRELYVVCTCAWAQVSGDADFDAAHDDGDGGGGGDDNRVPITGGTPYLTAGAWLAIGLGMHVVACGLLYEVSVASGSRRGICSRAPPLHRSEEQQPPRRGGGAAHSSVLRALALTRRRRIASRHRSESIVTAARRVAVRPAPSSLHSALAASTPRRTARLTATATCGSSGTRPRSCSSCC